MNRRDGRWRRGATGGWLAALAVSLPAWAQGETPAPPEDPTEEPAAAVAAEASGEEASGAAIDVAADVPALLRPEATRGERVASATELISSRWLAPVREALLGAPEAAEAARAAIARSAGSAELYGLLEETARARGDEEGLAAAGLLGQWSDRDAVRALVRLLRAGSERPELARAAATALERITGRPVDASDPGVFLAWWSDAEWLPEGDWQASLARAHRERALRAEAEREALAAKTLDLYERLYAQMPSEGRAGLLREMLESPRRRVRVAGLRLVERALLNGRVVDPALGGPAAAMLLDPEAEVRRLAARSLLRFAPAAGAPAAVAALDRESDPETAVTLMDLASSGEATVRAAELAEPWLVGGSGAARDAAANLIRTALERGQTPGAAFVSRVREKAAEAVSDEPTAALVRLLALVGGEEELELISAALAAAGEGPAAAAAVRALEGMPGGLAALSGIVENEPGLRPLVADALSRGPGGLAIYRFLLRVPGLGEDHRREALQRVWGTLEGAELLAAAGETASPAIRVALLRERLEGGGGNGQRAELPAETREALTVLLAGALLDQDLPVEAVATLGRLSPEAQRRAAAAAARAISRLLALREKGEAGVEAAALTACDPSVLAEAIGRLADEDPAAALAAADWPALANHVRSNEAAASVLEEIVRVAGDAVAAERAGDVEEAGRGTTPPDQGLPQGSIGPVSGR